MQIVGATIGTFDAAGRSFIGTANRSNWSREEREEYRLSGLKKRSPLESVNTAQLEKRGIQVEAS